MTTSDESFNAGRPAWRFPAWQYVIAWLLVLAAASEFVVRGPLMKPATLWDFAVIYSAAKVWGDGGNPYDNAQVARVWARGGGIRTVTNDLSWLPSLVLPSVLTVVWPFTLLPPIGASWAWIAASMLLLALALAALLRLAGLAALSPPGLCFIAFALAFAPVHVAMLTGQPALWCAAAIILAVWSDWRGGRAGPIVGGILLGLATALKPQLGGPFICYFLLRRNWTTAFWAAAVATLALGVGLCRLELTGTPWLTDWRANLAFANGAGGSNDYDFGNKTRDHLVQLQMLLWPMLKDRMWTAALTLLICGSATLAYAVLLLRLPRRDRSGRTTLLALAPLAVLTLLPTYHRYYDATILLVPLAWTFAQLNATPSRLDERSVDFRPFIALMLLLLFLMPLAFWTNLIRYHYLKPDVQFLAVWNLLLIPYHVWGELALLGVLLIALKAESVADSVRSRGFAAVTP